MQHHQHTLDSMDGPLTAFANALPPLLEAFYAKPHGDFTRWQTALEQLPAFQCTELYERHGLHIDGVFELPLSLDSIKALLMPFHPWRKGPYHLNEVHLDTEWRSDWKWQRINPHLAPLTGKRVLDVGCGNGYHSWLMALAGAKQVVGIDPMLLFNMQFRCIKHFAAAHPMAQNIDVLPLGIDDMPKELGAFDTVFSMGVLYHRKDPLEHIQTLTSLLSPSGELVLETLVVEPELLNQEQRRSGVLVPEKRYAQMRNVWAIPTTETLLNWMETAGLKHCQLVDVSNTTCDEQRATDWMTFQSLADFLDSDDRSKTVEGLPAPRRAMIIAKV